MAYNCKNNWCTKFTLQGCLIPEPQNKCPFLRLKMLEDIEELAERTRAAQKRYFSSRSHDDLNTSKKLEFELDAAIRKFKQPISYVQEKFL